jgi:membrane dipeptidase
MRSARGGSFLLAAAILVVVCGPAAAQEDAAALEHAKRVLKKSILFDGHNDLPWAIRTYKAAPGDLAAYDLRRRTPGQTDLERLRLGGVGAQFWSVYIPGEATGAARTQLEQIDLTRRLIARYPEALQLAGTAAEIRAAHRAGRIGSMLGIEGGHAIENSLGALRAYYDLGVRYMTLTHNTHTDWADSAAQDPPRWHGLNELGERVVLEMNRIGMLVDLSHTSAETMDDALRVSRAPVIFSHSAARALCDVPRNVPDDIVRRLPGNGGVLMITFVSGFIDENVAKVMQPAIDELNARSRDPSLTDADRQKLQEEIFGKLEMPRTSIARVADHIEHVRKVAGVEYVGIGGDFDGNDLWPEGLSDVSGYPHLFAELIRRGWTDRELGLLAGGNVLRALERAEKVAAELQKAAR